MKHDRTPITSAALYRDVSGIARMCSGEGLRRDRSEPSQYTATGTPLTKHEEGVSMEVAGVGNEDDDLEMLLYRGEEGMCSQRLHDFLHNYSPYSRDCPYDHEENGGR